MDSESPLFQISKNTIERNLRFIDGKRYLVAGGHQFETLWTRDFSFAARGLLKLKMYDVVKNHLTLLLDHLRKDGLVARCFDTANINYRVLASTALPFLPRPDFKGKLKAQYEGEHGTIAIDSNFLILITASKYYSATKDQVWWKEYGPKLVKLFSYYKKHLDDGLITQGAYCDWQDSVQRVGKTFYTNILYFEVLRRYQSHKLFTISKDEITALKKNLLANFLDKRSGLFKSVMGKEQISIDGNLLALHNKLLLSEKERDALYESLKKSTLWKSFQTTLPNYPSSEVSWNVKLIGLSHYHDELTWSWLMALQAKVAKLMGDEKESEKIFTLLEKMALRDQGVGEIYEYKNKELKLFSRKFYDSEIPFSWGAGMCLDALKGKNSD